MTAIEALAKAHERIEELRTANDCLKASRILLRICDKIADAGKRLHEGKASDVEWDWVAEARGVIARVGGRLCKLEQSKLIFR